MSSTIRSKPTGQPTRVSPWAIVRSGLLSGSLLVTSVIGGSTVVQPATTALAATVANPPSTTGVQILVFPQRDFVSASGYSADDRVVVKVMHPNGATISTDPTTPLAPQADPRAPVGAPFAGIVEVNHPGGACWFQTTPDIRPGDVVEIDIVAGPRAGTADATTVRNVTAGRPVQTAPDTVQIHGTAVQADGVTPIPAGELEQRMVANRDAFLLNGRRTLRATPAAGSDGTLAYDAPGSTNWTATYAGLQADDVTRALGAESRVLWIPPVVPATEGTIYENGAGVTAGPAAPCTAPLEKLPPPPGSDATPPSDVTGLTAALSNGNTVTLNWTAASDNVGVVDYGIYRDGAAIFNVQNVDGSAPAPTTFTDKNVPPGTYTYTVDAGDAAGNRSVNPSNGQTVTTTRPVATLPANITVHDPPAAPVQIISFPSRDFISSSGFLDTDTVDVQVLRDEGGPDLTLVSSSTWTPQADPRAAPTDPFAGIVEINHPGGACWDGTTPDIRAGDIIRTIAYNPDGTIRTVDQTRTANATVTRTGVEVTNASSASAADGVIKVHGQAMDKDGKPLPADQVEQRMIANRDHFVLNGRRVIRAGGAGKDGTFAYDAKDSTGTHWTATYSGLVQQDVDRVMGLNGFAGAEFRTLWLGSQPLAGLELTIFENDPSAIANGPSVPPCSAGASPSEPFDTAAPSTPTLSGGMSAANPKNVDLSWPASTDNVAVAGYGVYRDGTRVANLGPAARSFTDQNVSSGTHTYTVDAVDAASPANGLPSGQNNEWGNHSAPSNSVFVTLADSTAPTAPANLVATAGTGSVALSWSASTDDVGVVSYGVYRNGTKIADATTNSFTDPSSASSPPLAAGTYSYTVDAVDAGGNRSAQSAAASANVTAVADTTPPSVPTGLAAANSPDIHGKDVKLTWTASTDTVGVTGYGIYRAGTKIADVNGTPLAYTDANLSAGTYDYTVDAVDSAGNRSAQSTKATAVVANDPPLAPHNVIGFPARDFISATGYTPGATYTFSLIRGGTVYASGEQVADATGTVEVNHPGGTCWTVNTPDMRAGDVIRITNVATGVAEQTTVANVTAQRPIVTATSGTGGTVTIHGTAQDAAGNPLPVAQVESRLIANRDAFDLNGRRTLRAGGAGTDGTLTYDAPGSTSWTATYQLATANDLARAVGGTSATGTSFVGAESRAVWLGRDPVALTEGTIFEDGAGVVGGPAGGTCTAPAETPVAAATFSPTSLDLGSQGAVPASTSAAKTVTFSNGGGAPMSISAVYLAGLNPADFAISSNTCPATLAAGASCTVGVTFSPKALGARQANLSFLDNAANTTDQSVVLSGTGTDSAAPSAPGVPSQTLAASSKLTVKTGTALGDSTIPVTLKWTASTGTLTGYQLQQSVNSGAFADVTPQPSGATASVTLDLPMGTTTAPKTYQFQVRACNNANCTAWVLGPKFSTLPIDDANTSFVSFNGTWTSQAVAGAYGGTVRFAGTSKDKAALPNKVTFTTTGSGAWIGIMGPDRGQATVSIDGGPATMVDLYAPTQQVGVIGFAANDLKAGVQHSITIQVLGTKNVASTGTRVDLDAFVLLK